MEAVRTAARRMYAAELVLNWPVHSYYMWMVFVHAGDTGFAPLTTLLAAVYLAVTWVFVVDDLKLYRFLDTAPVPPTVPPTRIPGWGGAGPVLHLRGTTKVH